MAKSNKKLGKGLEALLGGDVNEFIDELEQNYNKDEVVSLKLSDITPNPFQPRKVFDDEKIEELAQSISEHGVFTPIIVKKAAIGYNIVAGERRYRAAIKVALETLPAIIVDIDDKSMMEIALLENVQRENLNPIEEAEALKQIMDYSNYTQEELAKKMGKSRSHIANTLRLLSLNERIKELILNQKISMGHAKVLIGLDNDILEIVVNEILGKNLSVRETEKLVQDLKTEHKPKKKIKQVNAEYLEVESNLRERLGTKVKVDNKSINIYFENEDDLNRLMELLNVNID
ncbi:ParB/RepB/Spo0J family partition protein [Mycoplasma sp. P36-A1]|uniref:ParB/RepB/Spo0J family partition protein n=1 Tax=Mycoplasma sp. P36-A1 TaxID=3252900 RepID=UPI003C2FCDD7